MKILKLSADIPEPMPSLGLRSLALAMIIIVAASCLVSLGVAPDRDVYPATVKALSGVAAIVGSWYLTRAIGLTLLRSGGTTAFRAAYLGAAALGGLGMAEVLSALWPMNIGNALAACCVISLASGALWTRFYGCTA
jgi:hypothetical protein